MTLKLDLYLKICYNFWELLAQRAYTFLTRTMQQELISVIDTANQLGKSKQTIFKIIRRLGIKPLKCRDSASRNQMISYITQEELCRVSNEVNPSTGKIVVNASDADSNDTLFSTENGVFYLVQLEPNHDPGRFKVGFAANMSERLRQLRCSAPFASIIKTWYCKRLWERTAIDCVTVNCNQLHTEVFRTKSIDIVASKCEQFFGIMPSKRSNSK